MADGDAAEPAVLSLIGAPFAQLRARLASRPDTEHEQALVRVVICLLLGAYILPGGLLVWRWNAFEFHYVAFAAYALVSVSVLASILVSRTVSHLRRGVGLAADCAIVSITMWYYGAQALPMFLFYIWVTLANGFRYGPRYLLITLGASLAGFAAVVVATDFWQQYLMVGAGLALGHAALSLYVLNLVRRMFDALARAEGANQAKRRFISVVSHELRTPLNAIVGTSDLLGDTRLSREQNDLLQTLRSSSRLMMGLVDEVLDFSKIEAGKLVLERTDFDLHALVNSTCRILCAQASAKNVGFVISIMPEVPPAVRGDAHRLRQVLINLAGNAVKFTEHGSVTVHLSNQVENDSSVRLKFSVRDTGVGIAPEAQSRIFESFTQADQSTTRRFGGTGLGTTIAKHLVELMGGRIGLESAVGLGSTFWFEIELEKQPERADSGQSELAGARVLLVGFPVAQREALERSLRRWRAKPIITAEVPEGVAQLATESGCESPCHSVLVYSEGADFTVAQAFRRTAPDPAPPLVLVIPSGTDVSRFAALSAGFAALLEIPFVEQRLFNVLHSLTASEERFSRVVRPRDHERSAPPAKGLRVLVADDNPTIREVLGRILERGGHTATLVASGEHALDACEASGYDVALIDRNMPDMGGAETVQALRLITGARPKLPIAILSADVTPEAKRESLAAGADLFLAKPIEAKHLLAEVQRLYATRSCKTPMAGPAPPARSDQMSKPAPALVIRLETLRDLEALSVSPAFMHKLIGVFVADSVTLMAGMEAALGARNVAEFRSQVHAMKGSAASIGAERLTQLCNDIGRLSEPEIKLQVPALLKSMRGELAATRAALERYLREHSESTEPVN